MSARRYKDKERLAPFIPLFKETMRTPAWRAMSHGARSLFTELRFRYSNSFKNNGRLYLSQRDARKELGSGFEEIVNWFRELQHFGFIVQTTPGYLGVDGKGKAPHWRLTDIGYMGDPPTRDFLKWDGTKFERRGRRRKKTESRTGNPVHSATEIRCTPATEIRSGSGGKRTGNPVHIRR
jgi:hypothetical protein